MRSTFKPSTYANLDGITATIELTQDAVAIIDLADMERIGQHRWCLTVTKQGMRYAKRKGITIDGRQTSIMLHRAVVDAPAGTDVDHANHDGLDCRHANLRIASRSQNMANVPKTERPTSSQFKGVRYVALKDRWYAEIRENGRNRHLGTFRDEAAAARAYDLAAAALYGIFATLNFEADREAYAAQVPTPASRRRTAA